ncbi:serine-rich adhesin for platelets [Toxorhynchites rutilus septentrionalis]|uniref:serine-rich adhesin for platelets n=1 Tax=Toxorhynchites rutilus septentrionalis TaxID=329112 RepID=UPI00247A0D46|nr:serine-rich adhesin for platelets [Toxorhynchites rutilus septentrionalis]
MKNLSVFCGVVLLLAGVDLGIEARAVNISNTWTLPQDGFTVFYRYFRDKISWFEADAVCQFHHANLVTVENGVQFDAARAFLKELDVTNPVWIGLMRPENSARFTWTNAKSLDPSSGYWAESLPAMETPLCAVVDPVRDFRWHALRCGGPETAAFLCELPVPNWASDCTITSMPSLTVQYMSDSGAVQLSRDCGEQGTKHMSCQGKLDRDTIIQQLQCSEQEEDPAQAATEDNRLPLEMAALPPQSTITRKPQLPQILEHDILTVVSNNDEDNNIDVNPNQIEDTVKNVINKFNLADLMQGEQSLHSEETDVRFSEQDKDGKKVGTKKYSPLFEKKDKFGKKDAKKMDEEEEMMMGDQPDETETQPIDIVQQAVKPTEGESDESLITNVSIGSTESAVSSELAITESTTADSRLRRATDGETTSETSLSSTTELQTEPTTTTTTTTMESTTSSTASHILPTTPKKETASIGDHFIPPMLMVKARFTSTKSHIDATTASEHSTETSEPTIPSSTVPPTSTTEQLTTTIVSVDSAQNNSEVQLTELDDKTSTVEILHSSEAETTTNHQIVEITFDDKELTSKFGTLSITTRPFPSDAIKTSTETIESTTTVASTTQKNTTTIHETSPSAVILSTSTATSEIIQRSSTPTLTSTITTTTAPTTTTVPTPAPIEHELLEDQEDHEQGEGEDHQTEEDDEHHNQELHNSFSNIENYQPYKPNRHRSLTKPEVHNNHGNYIKKILG